MFILTLDGFTPAALSCYGSSWNATRQIDRVAASGSLWDRVITPHTDPLVQMQRWLGDRRLPADAITLVTDDARLIDPSAADRHAIERLDKVVLIDEPAIAVAEQIEETRLMQLMAVATSYLDQSEMVWLHSRFLTRGWDAPRDLFPFDEVDEDDFTSEGTWDDDDDETADDHDAARFVDPVVGLELGGTPRPPLIFPDLLPPQLRFCGDEHPDTTMAWMRTYGCQIQLVDALIAVLDGFLKDASQSLILAGCSGFSLGQNGHIGHRTGPTRSCHLRVPLITNQPGAGRDGAGMRDPHLRSAKHLVDVILATRSGDGRPVISPAMWAAPTNPEISVVSRDENEAIAVTTPHWFYEATTPGLFLKPDDVDDMNDVCRLEPDVVERLRVSLGAGGKD